MIDYHINRRIFWRSAYYWSIVRLRRRAVVGMVVLIVLFALVWTFSSTWIYSARTVIRVEGLDERGILTNEPPSFTSSAQF